MKGQTPAIVVKHMDHLVLTVTDIKMTAAFYCSVLGMKEQSSGSGGKMLCFGQQSLSLEDKTDRIEPNAKYPTPGSLSMSFAVATPVALVVESLKSLGIKIVDGPVERVGAMGPMTAIYIRDPEGNSIELANYAARGYRG